MVSARHSRSNRLVDPNSKSPPLAIQAAFQADTPAQCASHLPVALAKLIHRTPQRFVLQFQRATVASVNHTMSRPPSHATHLFLRPPFARCALVLHRCTRSLRVARRLVERSQQIIARLGLSTLALPTSIQCVNPLLGISMCSSRERTENRLQRRESDVRQFSRERTERARP